MSRLSLCLLTLVSSLLSIPLIAAEATEVDGGEGEAGGEAAVAVGFVERFALAADREAVLDELVPGTEEHFYYRALLHQQRGELAAVDELVARWRERNRHSRLRERIEFRQILLRYDAEPEASLGALARELELRFDHQPQRQGAGPEHPSVLDQDLVVWEAFRRRLPGNDPSGVTEAGLWRYLSDRHAQQHRRRILERLTWPDHPELVDWLLADLADRRTPGFGSLELHQRLTRGQLELLRARRPQLVDDEAYVRAYLRTLRPGPEVDLARDRAARLAWLERAWAFAADLPPVHNSLKAHLLYHRLELDRQMGTFDRELLTTYLALPRQVAYVDATWLGRQDVAARVDLGRAFETASDLPPVGDDEALVRALLLADLREADEPRAYTPYLDDRWLERVFVEAKVTAGVGDAEAWFARLDDPSFFARLRERVDIDIAPTNPEYHAPDAAVSLAVDVKNVERLLVRIYEIDAGNVYRETGAEFGVGLDLDGLIANHQRTLAFDAPPLHRVRREIDLPEIAGRGTWIVELIGNGRSSRALIRIGDLVLHEQPSAAGHRCRIVDAAGEHRPDASLWLAGHRYQAGEDGIITLPFTGDAGRQAVVLEDGPVASLAHFHHREETYRLEAAIHVDRERLIAGSEAPLLIRAWLSVHGEAVPIALLEDERLRITAIDHDGTETALEIEDLELAADGEAIHRFRVPEGLRRIEVELGGTVASVSSGEDQALSTSRSFAINGIADSVQVAQSHLAATAAGWVLYRLDRNGEPVAGVAVRCGFHHRDFTTPFETVLQTDAAGRIELGALAGIERVTARVDGDPQPLREWRLRDEPAPVPSVLHARVGDVLRLPYPEGGQDPQRQALACFELRAGAPAVDRFDQLRLADGFLELVGLAAGDYLLVFKERGQQVHLRVDAGRVHGETLHAPARLIELPAAAPVALRRAEIEGDELLIELAGHGPETRVHVFADRFQPAFDHVVGLALPPPGLDAGSWHRPGNEWASGRRIGEEYRYILERRQAERYPGLMLERPGLLLNPWALSETATDEAAQGGTGGGFGSRQGDRRARAADHFGGEGAARTEAGYQADLDFLARPAAVFLQRRVDETGRLRIPRAELGDARQVRVVVVGPTSSTAARVLLPETPLQVRDRRLADGFDPESHVSRQQRTTVLAPGDELVIADFESARLELYDSLGDVFALYRTLAPEAGLADFSFLAEWGELDPAAKRARYDEFACHELHLYCFLKDRAFFDAVIAPYLANKRDPTPLDRWLLGETLDDLLAPERYQRLNLLERILLGERIDGEAAAARRQLRERFELLDRDRAALGRLFDAALRGRSLDTADELGMRAARDRLAKAESEAGGLAYAAEEGDDGLAMSESLRSEMVPAMTAAPAADAGLALAAPMEELQQLRAEQRQYYRPLEPTTEWAENNYYHLPYARQDGDLLPVNAFWRDLALHEGLGAFRSPAFIEAASSRTEILLALALLDLPVAAGDHAVVYADGSMRLTAASPAIAFHEEFRPVAEVAVDDSLLMRQLAFRHGERYREVDGERIDAVVRDEFVVDTPYSLEVVVTNTGSRPRAVDLLLQIPEGALPLAGASATEGLAFTVAPYATERRSVSFFFPRPGDFGHFPAHLAHEGEVLAHAEALNFHVVAEPTRVDTGSWRYVSQHGSLDEVVAYLEAHNLQRVDLELVAWRLREAESYRRLVELLDAHHHYHPTLWSYAVHHDDAPRIASYLQRRDDIVHHVGPWLDSPLYTSDPVFDGHYRHLEYAPLVNPRAHAFGGVRRITNDRLREQYRALMEQLAHKGALSAEDQLGVVSYLFLQDRIGEALRRLAALDTEAVREELQLAYLRCYAAFARGEPELARDIAEGYREHPVARWRDRFARIVAQAETIAGGGEQTVDPEDPAQRQGALAATEPSFSLALDGAELLVDHRNLAECTVNFYLMDVELLFSRDPFVDEDADRFAVIKPNERLEVALPEAEGVTRVALPEALRSRNVMIEVVGAGRHRSIASFANQLSVQVIENYGRLEVRHADTRDALDTVYVKVYARLEDGSTVFYKDGYTDLRGRFDYLALNTDELGRAREFAILVLSDEHGAVIRRVQPPKR